MSGYSILPGMYKHAGGNFQGVCVSKISRDDERILTRTQFFAQPNDNSLCVEAPNVLKGDVMLHGGIRILLSPMKLNIACMLRVLYKKSAGSYTWYSGMAQT